MEGMDGTVYGLVKQEIAQIGGTSLMAGEPPPQGAARDQHAPGAPSPYDGDEPRPTHYDEIGADGAQRDEQAQRPLGKHGKKQIDRKQPSLAGIGRLLGIHAPERP